VVELVRAIIAALKQDEAADVQAQREEIDDAIFDLFDIHAARGEVLRFYNAIGRVEISGEDGAAPDAQAAVSP